MSENKINQAQNAENNSTQIQVGRDLNLSGLSYSDVKEICIDVYRRNALILSDEAAKVVNERVVEFVEDFIKKAIEDKIESSVFAVPSLQHSLYNAQASYAKCGDETMKLNLISILIEQSKGVGRTEKNIILDEVLAVLPKLTNEHINFLSFVYALFPKYYYGKVPLDVTVSRINNIFSNFYSDNFFKPHFVRHLVNFKVLEPTSKYDNRTLINRLLSCYRGLFFKGFTVSEFEKSIGDSIGSYGFIITECINDSSMLQLDCLTEGDINFLLEKNNLRDKRKELHDLFKYNIMDEKEVKEKMLSVNSDFATVFTNWSAYPNEYSMSNNKLSLLGKIIACMNYSNNCLECHPLYCSIDNFLYSKYEL